MDAHLIKALKTMELDLLCREIRSISDRISSRVDLCMARESKVTPSGQITQIMGLCQTWMSLKDKRSALLNEMKPMVPQV